MLLLLLLLLLPLHKPNTPKFQDGLRSGLEAAAGITGRAVPWVLAPSAAAAATAAATAAAEAAPLGSPSAEQDAPSSSSPPSSLPPSPTRALSFASHASALTRGLVLPQPRVCLGRTTWPRRVVRWGVSAVEALAVRAISGFLRHTVAKGCMTIACPDGREMRFGDPGAVPEEGAPGGDGTSSGAGRKIAIRVFDWWFFVRVAMEYDLGLARCVVDLSVRCGTRSVLVLIVEAGVSFRFWFVLGRGAPCFCRVLFSVRSWRAPDRSPLRDARCYSYPSYPSCLR